MGALRFSKTYFIATVIVLCIEILIALFVRDNFIRPYFGDSLAVILVYCFFKILVKAKKLEILLFALFLAFAIETLQATNFLGYMGLEDNRFALILLGNSFSWGDMLAYVGGAVLIVIFEYSIPNPWTVKTS